MVTFTKNKINLTDISCLLSTDDLVNNIEFKIKIRKNKQFLKSNNDHSKIIEYRPKTIVFNCFRHECEVLPAIFRQQKFSVL